MKQHGFTLVELLITIFIISILTVVGFTIYSNVLKQGRDSKRQSDLRAVQSALEQYFADQFVYPDPVTIVFDGRALSAGTRTYMNNLPIDPTSSPNYAYVGSTCAPTCKSYCLYAKMENFPPTYKELHGCTDNPGSPYNFALPPP